MDQRVRKSIKRLVSQKLLKPRIQIKRMHEEKEGQIMHPVGGQRFPLLTNFVRSEGDDLRRGLTTVS